MASSHGRPVVIEGGRNYDGSPRTEILDMASSEWIAGSELDPSWIRTGSFQVQRLRRSTGIQTDVDTFYLVGGLASGYRQTAILKYESNTWTKLGDLMHARYWSAQVINGNDLWVIGGEVDLRQYTMVT